MSFRWPPLMFEHECALSTLLFITFLKQGCLIYGLVAPSTFFSNSSGAGGWFFIFQLLFCFLLIELNCVVLFPFLIKYNMDLFFTCPLCFSPYSRLSSYLLRLFLCLISSLLFPCACFWENALARVSHFL